MKKFFLVVMVVLFAVGTVSASVNICPYKTRSAVAVVNDSDGYRNILETADGHQWLIDGYDLRIHGTCLVKFNTFNTDDVTDDFILQVVEVD